MSRSIVAAIVVLLLFSCKTTVVTHVPRTEQYFGINFTEYSKRGFLFAPGQYSGQFDAIGLISLTVLPEANRVKKVAEASADQWKEQPAIFEWKIEKINVDEAVNLIYKKCTELGADALIDFKILPQSEQYPFYLPPLKVDGFVISGFAIKRKN